MKIQHITNDFIETYNSTSAGRLAARVVKQPVGEAGYVVVATIWCGNFIGCVANVWDAALDFNRSVNAVWIPQGPPPAAPVGGSPLQRTGGTWRLTRFLGGNVARPEVLGHASSMQECLATRDAIAPNYPGEKLFCEGN